MSVKYEPSISHLLCGNTIYENEADWAENGLRWLLEVIYLTYNIDDPEFESDLFSLRPFCWEEDEEKSQLPNFEYKPTGLKVSWYRSIGRGMSTNVEHEPDDWCTIINNCVLLAIKAQENGQAQYGDEFEEDDSDLI